MSDRDILEIVDDAVRAIFGKFSPEQTEICSRTFSNANSFFTFSANRGCRAKNVKYRFYCEAL